MIFKRGFVVCFFVFICTLSLHTVFAAQSTETLHDAYVYEQTDLVLDDNTLPVSVVLTSGKARIILDGDQTVLLDYGSTKKIGFYTISVGSYQTDGCDGFEDNKYCKVRSTVLDGNEAITKLTIIKHIPLIEVEYEINTEEFYVGATQEVTIRITNTGDVDLYDLEFIDEYPWDLFLGDASAGTIIDNTLRYTRNNFQKGSEAVITFDVDIRGPSDTTQVGRLTYSDGVNTQTIAVDPIKLKTVNPLSFSFSFTEKIGSKVVSNPEVDTEYEFSLLVENHADSSFNLNDLEMEFSPQFVVNEFAITPIDDRYIYKGYINNNRQFEGVGKLMNGSVSVFFSYTHEGVYYSDDEVLSVVVPVDFVEEIDVSTDVIYRRTHGGKYIPGTREGYYVSLKNVGDVILENVEGILNSTLFDPVSFYIPVVKVGETVVLADHFFVIPDVVEETTHVISTSLSYDGSGETFIKTQSENVVVYPIFDIISASYEVNKVSDFEHVISGSIKSRLPYNVYFDMQLLHSLGPKIISDDRQYSAILTKLEPDEEKQILSYSFFIGEGAKETISTSFWLNDVVEKVSFDVEGTSPGSSELKALDISFSLSDKLDVGKPSVLNIVFENVASETLYQNIFLRFKPNSQITLDSYGLTKITNLAPGERYVEEIPFTALRSGNYSLGSFIITYFSDTGEPFVFDEVTIPVFVNGNIGVPSTIQFVNGSVTLLGEGSDNIMAQVVLTNPTTSQLDGSFTIGNNSFAYGLAAGETKDYFYGISRIDADTLSANGLVVETEQLSSEATKQVLTVGYGVQATNDLSVVISNDGASNGSSGLTGTAESTIVLVSDENVVGSKSSDTLILSIVIFVSVFLLVVVFAKIYKKKKMGHIQ